LIPEKYKPQLTVEDIEEILGIEKYDEEIAEKTRYFIRSSYRNPAAACYPQRGQPRECKIGDTKVSDYILYKELMLT